MTLLERLRQLVDEPIVLPGAGATPERHRRLIAVGREDLSLARLAEAHWDAVAILAEAGREAAPGALYGVWAAELPGTALMLDGHAGGFQINGTKMFCSGAGLVDRALVTVTNTDARLIAVDLRAHPECVAFDDSSWQTGAFAETNTAMGAFRDFPVSAEDCIGDPGWYLDRPGFWHGACGPAACWAGGALGLVDYALAQKRNDPHTLAHLGAMRADAWALAAYLDVAGHEIDADPLDAMQARVRARTVRHLVEQASTDILRRLARAFGPHPLAMNKAVSRRYQELDLYLRQSHAERDLEALGKDLRERIS